MKLVLATTAAVAIFAAAPVMAQNAAPSSDPGANIGVTVGASPGDRLDPSASGGIAPSTDTATSPPPAAGPAASETPTSTQVIASTPSEAGPPPSAYPMCRTPTQDRCREVGHYR